MEIRLTSKDTRKAALDLLAAAAEELQRVAPETTTTAGWRTLRSLQHLDHDGRERLAALLSVLIVSCDLPRIEWALQALLKGDGERSVVLELIQRNASYEMMTRLAPIPYRAYWELRRNLGMTSPRGRPKVPSERIRLDVLCEYRRLAASHPPANAMLRLHDRFAQFSLTALYYVVSRDDAQLGIPARTGSKDRQKDAA